MPDRFLNKTEVSRITSLCPGSINNGVKAGTFPAPVNISTGRVAWLESEVNAWMKERAAAPRTRKAAPPNRAGYRGGRPRKVAPQTAQLDAGVAA